MASFSSSDFWTTVAVAMLTLLAAWLWRAAFKRGGRPLPAGPWGLPLLGNLTLFRSDPPAVINRLRHKYGDVMGLRLGGWRTVVVSGRDAIREALVARGDDFSGRPDFTVARALRGHGDFVFATLTPAWKAQRRIIRNAIHGVLHARRAVFQDVVLSEARTLVGELLDHQGDSFCPERILEVPAVSVIHKLFYGAHFEGRENGEFRRILDRNRCFTGFVSRCPVNSMPWLRFLLPGALSRFVDNISEDTRLRRALVEEHEKTFDAGNIRDMTDSLIHAGNSLTAEQRAAGLDKVKVTDSLKITGAAGDTVGSVLQWFVYLMAANPHVQEAAFREIDGVVGGGREVSLEDRPRLGLVEACVCETMRLTSSVPLAIPHCTTRTTSLRGQALAQGTVVVVNLSSVARDPELWGADPGSFRPSRFLLADGRLNGAAVERACVFSLGRRRCLGEPLARAELFLLAASLLQRLRFRQPPGHPGYPPVPHFGLSPTPAPYRVCVERRD